MIAEMWKPYQKHCSFYEVVECLRRMMLTGVVVFVFPSSVAQVSTTFLISLFFFAFSEVLNLSVSHFDSWMYRFGNRIVLLSMFLAVLIKINTSEDEESDLDTYAVVLVACNVVMALALAGGTAATLLPYAFARPSEEGFCHRWRRLFLWG